MTDTKLYIESLDTEVPIKDGIIYFPPDAEIRRKYFSAADKNHPAKANFYMMAWLIEHLTKPGDTILDPTSGVGTLMYATLLGRNVINIELEERYVEIQTINWHHFVQNFHPTGSFVLHHGDARRYLPCKADHCIFSPPYSVNISRGGTQVAKMAAESGTFVGDYGHNTAQLADLGYFNLMLAMKEIYRQLYASLPSGGYMCTITKDSVNSKAAKHRMLNGIEPYSADNLRACYEVGFELFNWYIRDAKPSLRLQIAWQQNPGIPHVVTEDMIVMRKP